MTGSGRSASRRPVADRRVARSPGATLSAGSSQRRSRAPRPDEVTPPVTPGEALDARAHRVAARLPPRPAPGARRARRSEATWAVVEVDAAEGRDAERVVGPVRLRRTAEPRRARDRHLAGPRRAGEGRRPAGRSCWCWTGRARPGRCDGAGGDDRAATQAAVGLLRSSGCRVRARRRRGAGGDPAAVASPGAAPPGTTEPQAPVGSWGSSVGDTGIEPVTSSVSGKRATAAPIARPGLATGPSSALVLRGGERGGDGI